MELIGNEYLMGEIMELMESELVASELGVTNLVPVVVGDPGTGKSESWKALASRLNYGVVIFSLGAHPEEGFSGIPEFVDLKIDSIYSVVGSNTAKGTEWTMSDIIRTINRVTEQAIIDGKKGVIVVLDDLHLVGHITQKYLFEFLQNKTLQNFRIHPKAHLVGAMNGKESAGMEGFLSAIIDRLSIYHAKFDKEYWYNAIGHNLHPLVASFSKGANDRYFVGANSIDGSSPSPRSWTELSQMLDVLEKRYPIRNDLNIRIKMMAEARVGQEATVEFMKHVKLFQQFDFATVLAKKDPNFNIPDDISDQIILSFIIRYLTSKEEVDYLIDILNRNKDRRTFISVLVNEYEVILRNLASMPEGSSKDAFNYFSECIMDEDKFDEDLLGTIIEGVIDIM